MSSYNKITASFLIEVLGRPPEHLEKTLSNIIERINNEEGVIKIIKKDIKSPAPLKQQQDLFISFAEIELEAEDINVISGIVFRYMPSNIEIISPEKLSIKNSNLNDFVNEVTRRLHSYDEIARVIQNEKAILEKQVKELKNKKHN
ncbi:MAG: hypothetical protein ACOC3Z_01105 [Nanoarchaeota archaeon]